LALSPDGIVIHQASPSFQTRRARNEAMLGLIMSSMMTFVSTQAKEHAVKRDH
jgi:hypothetical protein